MNPHLHSLPGSYSDATLPINPPDGRAAAGFPESLRCLKPDELVRAGDYVMNTRQEFELWEGPAGFRADSFLKPIYRRTDGRPGDDSDSGLSRTS